MNDYATAERVIDLKDMCYRILKFWRNIVVGAIIIALLAGLSQLTKGIILMTNEEELNALQEKYEIMLADYEATGERLKATIADLQEQSANQREYNNKSVLMKIDPMNKWSGNFQFYIDSKYHIDPSLSYQNLDMTNRLISAYASFLRSGGLYNEILAQSPEISEIRFLSEIYGVSADSDNATIIVSCVGATESDVRQILDFVKTKLAEHFETVRDAIGDHSYDILMESVYSTIDLGLDATQKANLLAVLDYSNKISETNIELEEWERTKEPRPDFGAWYTTKQTIKKTIIGGVIGLIVMLAWFAIKYVMTNTLKTDDDWRRFGLPVLGIIIRDEKKKKFLPGFDVLIDQLFGHTRSATQEQTCTLVAQNLWAVGKERDLSEINMIGHLPDDLAEAISKSMNATGSGITFKYAGNLLTDPSTSTNLKNSKEVVLLAERYTTRSSDVEQSLTLLNAWGKKVMGAVVVE